MIGMAIVEKVGVDIGINVVKGVASSAKSISKMLGFIKDDDEHSELVKLLKDTDVEVTVKILECIVLELKVHSKTPASVINALKAVHESLMSIEDELKEIQRRLEYNNSLYVFKAIRSWGFTSRIKNIKAILSTLENRKKLLFETIEISSSLERGHINRSILEGSWLMPTGHDGVTNILGLLEEDKPKKNTETSIVEVKNMHTLENSDISVLDDEFNDRPSKRKKKRRRKHSKSLSEQRLLKSAFV